MNASLNVYVERFPIRDWQELADSQYRVLTRLGTSFETALKKSPSGSSLKRIHEEKIATVPKKLHLTNGYESGVKHVLDESAVIYAELEPYMKMREFYPCQIIDIKTMQ